MDLHGKPNPLNEISARTQGMCRLRYGFANFDKSPNIKGDFCQLPWRYPRAHKDSSDNVPLRPSPVDMNGA